jgi:hypothetical protein
MSEGGIGQEVVYRVSYTRDGDICVQVRDGRGLADSYFVKRRTRYDFNSVTEAEEWAEAQTTDEYERVRVSGHITKDQR